MRDQVAILDETLPGTVSLFDLASDTPLSWEQQRGQVADANWHCVGADTDLIRRAEIR